MKKKISSLGAKMSLLAPACVLMLAVGQTAFAQTVTSTPSASAAPYYGATTYPSNTASTSTRTPGAPNTGRGGEAPFNIAVLLASGIIVIGSGAYVARRLIGSHDGAFE